jgi:hypothetical protein
VGPAPGSRTTPADLEGWPDRTEWSDDVVQPYLGRTFDDILSSARDPIRNAVAHLTPGEDLRIAAHMDDVRACRNVTPALRYIPRSLIADELAALAPGPPVGCAPAYVPGQRGVADE